MELRIKILELSANRVSSNILIHLYRLFVEKAFNYHVEAWGRIGTLMNEVCGLRYEGSSWHPGDEELLLLVKNTIESYAATYILKLSEPLINCKYCDSQGVRMHFEGYSNKYLI